MQRMYGLGNMIAGEGQHAVFDSSFPLAHLGCQLFAAFGADKTCIAYHSQKMLLRIGNIVEITMRTFDYPLRLGTLCP